MDDIRKERSNEGPTLKLNKSFKQVTRRRFSRNPDTLGEGS